MEVRWLEQTLADVPSDDVWLSREERLRCSAFRIPKRRSEWRLGRWTAKHAVAAWLSLSYGPESLAAIEIRPGGSGAPEAFLRNQPANVCISLSHSGGVAACAVGSPDAEVGCDLEVVEPRDPVFVADYFTADEQKAISQATRPDRDALITLLWSAKESALKALRTGLRLDTRCVAAKIDMGVSLSANAWARLSICGPNNRVLRGWWHCSGKLVRTIVTVPSSGPPVMI